MVHFEFNDQHSFIIVSVGIIIVLATFHQISSSLTKQVLPLPHHLKLSQNSLSCVGQGFSNFLQPGTLLAQNPQMSSVQIYFFEQSNIRLITHIFLIIVCLFLGAFYS